MQAKKKQTYYGKATDQKHVYLYLELSFILHNPVAPQTYCLVHATSAMIKIGYSAD
jgi:hypothetical protein